MSYMWPKAHRLVFKMVDAHTYAYQCSACGIVLQLRADSGSKWEIREQGVWRPYYGVPCKTIV
jgi:hypothetical protein